jgi:putative N6-adenine-specific DNA methylase
MFAVTAPGLEAVCARELTALDMPEATPVKGGVTFSGGLTELYQANLWLRTASRVVVRLGAFRCSDFPELFRKALRLPWGRFIRPGTSLQVRVTSHRSRLTHGGRIAETLQEAMSRALGGAAGQTEAPRQLLLVRMEANRCVLSVDSSGELLHRRGYREHIGAAPLRETLAAGVLQLLGWDGRHSLVDPMCGSGTFLVEGAWLGMRRAPGLQRSFAFMQWPRYRAGLWAFLQAEARRREIDLAATLVGGDRDAAVLEAARGNAERAGVTGLVRFCRDDLAGSLKRPSAGLVLCNPPYGGRIGRGENLEDLYRRIGQVYRDRFRGWRGALLCPNGPLLRRTGLSWQCLARLDNGGIDVGLFAVRL